MPRSSNTFPDAPAHDNAVIEVAPISSEERGWVGDGATFDGMIAGRHQAVDDIPARSRGNNWMSLAKCRAMESEQFFRQDEDGVREARRICAVCPVKLACLAYALDHRLNDGVWGGASEHERRWCQAVRAVFR
jgi:WhiB family transcriptional regulator, redox-sensing transcriptional regulator